MRGTGSTRCGLHCPAALAARSCRRARAPRHGRRCRGSTRRVPRRTGPHGDPIVERVARAGRRMRRPPGRPLPMRRQRDPGADRALARAPARSRRSSSGSAARPKAEDPDALVTYVNYPSTEYLDFRSSTSRASTSSSSRGGPSRPTSPGCRTSPATGRSCWPRSASTASATASEAQADALGWQVRRAFERGLRRARSSSPGPTSGTAAAPTSTTGASGSTDARPIAEAGAGSGRGTRSPSRPVSRLERLASRLGGRLHATTGRRRSPSASRASHALDYPELRGDRRRRRLDRRHRREIAADFDVRADPHREPGTQRRAQHRHRGGERRDRRLPRRRRRPRPPLAALPRRRASSTTSTPASAGRTFLRRRRLARRCVASGARRADPRPRLGPRGRAHPRLQHGVPAGALSKQSAASTRSFRIAGDDVDVCWRLQERGWTLGFSAGSDGLAPPPQAPSARYWRQQPGTAARRRCSSGSGRSATTAAATSRWAGRVYGDRAARAIGRRRHRIRYGTWGSGLFQSVYDRSPSTLRARCR